MSEAASERTPLLAPQAAEPPPPYVEVAQNQTKSPYQEVNHDIHASLQDEIRAPDNERVDLHTSTESVRSLRDSQAHEEHATTNLQSLMHLLKGNIGTGILAMPSALKNAGLWVGFGGLFLMGFIAVHCMHLLVICSHRLCARTGNSSLDYGQVAEEAFKQNPRLQRFSKAAKNTINVFLCITQFGFCIVYILFIADNCKQVIEQFAPWKVDLRIYQVFVLLIIIPYLFVRNLKYLAPFSSIANFATVIGLVIIFQYCFQDPIPSVDDRPAFASWATLPLYFGTAIYAFEGIGVVLPIENKMKTPEDFRGLTGVLNTGMVIVTVLYVAVGFFGYLKFGDDVLGSITLNLPKDRWLYLSVKLIFAGAIFISYGLQFYVPIDIMWPNIRARLNPGFLHNYGEYLFRIALALLTLAVSVAVPHLDLMISLIGALASSTLALIFPPLLEILVFWPEMGKCKWKLSKNILISLFGFIGFVAGTVTTMIKIIQAFQTPGNNA